MLQLDLKEKTKLETLLKQTKDVSEWKRLFVILEFDRGITIDELARALRLSPVTIEKYIREYASSNKTRNDPRGGSESKLTEEQSKGLEKHLTKKTYLKVRHIIAYVEKEYRVKYSRSGMTLWLKEHGFAFKRPKRIPGKLDPEKQKAFIEAYEKLKKNLQLGEEIYFGDAVHPEHQSQVVSGWIRKGEQKTLQSTGTQHRLHFAGAINLENMVVVSKEYETVDADAMIDFCNTLENKSIAPVIHLILDNARANKNKKLDEYLKTSRIKIYYLSPYSPNLNPIERLWKIMREMVTYNRYFESCVEFFDSIRKFFKEVPKMKEILSLRINDVFQIIQPNPINLV